MVFQKKQSIFREMSYSPGQSAFLKINQNVPSNQFFA